MQNDEVMLDEPESEKTDGNMAVTEVGKHQSCGDDNKEVSDTKRFIETKEVDV